MLDSDIYRQSVPTNQKPCCMTINSNYEIATSQEFPQNRLAPSQLQTDQQGDPESYFTTALESGSPTDEDEEDYATPPSPTLSSRSAQRRVLANSRFPMGSTTRKRPSDSSDGSGTSTKLTRTSKGKQPADGIEVSSPPKPASPPLFKKPSLDMARSFQATSMKSSVNTSFNSMWSSQQTQPDTVATSFTSSAYDADVQYPKLTRTSSTTIGSLDDQDLMNVSARLERETASLQKELSQSSQDLTRESSSTFGSIDEDDLAATSFKVEAEYTLPQPSLPPPMSPSRSAAQSDSARQSQSPVKPGHLQNPVAEASSSSLRAHQPYPSPRTPSGRSTQQYGERVAVASPARPVSQSPQATLESPSKLSYYIRNIPSQNLFVEELPSKLIEFPYFILFICCRVSTTYGIPMSVLMRGMDIAKIRNNPTVFWTSMKDNTEDTNIVLREPPSVWSAAKKNFEGFTFKGRLVINNNNTTTNNNRGAGSPAEHRSDKAATTIDGNQVFNLELLPIQAEKSCRLQRKFGSDRFLYIDLPAFETAGKSKRPKFTIEDFKHIQNKWKEWYAREHSFLGRKWKAFHIESTKKKANRQKEDKPQKRMIMFAIEGIGIDQPMSIGEMLNWFFPFSENMDQNFCKAYARLDLGLSRTIPTLTFKPSQVHYIDDVRADGTPEDRRFNDQTLPWNERPRNLPVMNDGCSLISVGAALEIWKRYKKATGNKDPIPSIIQGRIAGAKGVWIVCGEPSTSDPTELDIWIQITRSQKKFEPHENDRSDDQPCDPQRLTFEHVDHSSSPAPSELHISFIPILTDRGVPREVIENIMVGRLDAERDELFTILSEPVQLYHWIHQQSSTTDENPHWQAALPHSLPNKIRHLLESGFVPEHEPYLASILKRFIKQRQTWMEQKLKVPLGKATFLFGISDPLGVLAPGEVHVDFSAPFVDELTGVTYRALNNIDLLVARQPACRPSDIQKVRAIKRPELSFLVDVVVFPSRGEYPMAGRLQGGDYDGDIFWLCWESDLVAPFKNAPAPMNDLDPLRYGIKKDTRKLHQIMLPNDLTTVDNLLKEVLEFRMAPSLLGRATNFHGKQAYKENKIYSARLDALCNIHDLLVDAPKQGYFLDHDGFTHYTQRILRCGSPTTPAYKQAMDDCEGAKELGEAKQMREKEYDYKDDNVLDYLYFRVVRKHNFATLSLLEDAFSKTCSDDAALQFPYVQVRNNSSEIVRAELDWLLEKLTDLGAKWRRMIKSKPSLTSELYNHTVDECYGEFRSLKPSNVGHPDIEPWLHPYLHYRFSIWESIRASALYTELPDRHAFVWHMAGRELSRLKCPTTAKHVVPDIFANLKSKPIKVPKTEEEDESEDELQSAVESVYT